MLTALIVAVAGLSAAEEAAQLPVTKVILYKHGVGYFERRGFVLGSREVALSVKIDDMNDVLKSLMALDLGGGSVASISYGSSKTIERLLSEYSFDLRKDAGMPGMLAQLQGAGVELKVGGKTIRGKIVSVETRNETRDKEIVRQRFKLAVFTDDDELRSFDTSEITSVEFADDKLRSDIARALEILFSAHMRDTRTVTIQTAGEGRRELLVGYVVEAPVWKATYRLVLSGEDDPLLQGWAIVDNTTDEDWTDIDLSLVSGMPVSFIMNIYDPRFKERPFIDIDGGEMRTDVGGDWEDWGGEEEEGKAEAEEALDVKKLRRDELLERQQALAGGRELGQLFEYSIDRPVSIDRNNSALIPIVNARVEAERVSLYNEGLRYDNPMSAIRMKNTTGLTLEGGAVTVYDGDTYAGESLFDTVKKDDQRYLAYAVDLGTTVSTKFGSSKQAAYRVQIRRGTMITHYKLARTKTYTLKNLDDREKIVIIEHPVEPEWKLAGGAEPIETTDDHYRFEVELRARDGAEWTVKEELPRSTSYSIANVTPEQIEFFVRQKYIDKELQQALGRIVDIKNEIAGLERKLKELERDRRRIFQDQERLRANIRALGATAEENELRSRYVEKMNAQEDALKRIDTSVKDITDNLAEARRALDAAIEALSADYEP